MRSYHVARCGTRGGNELGVFVSIASTSNVEALTASMSSHSPAVVSMSEAYLMLDDGSGDAFRSPTFVLDRECFVINPRQGILYTAEATTPAGQDQDTGAQVVFTTTTTVHITPSAVAHAYAPSATDASNSPNVTSPSLAASPLPQTNIINRTVSIGTVLAIAIPVGVVGIALIVTACICARYSVAERKSRSEAGKEEGGGRTGTGANGNMRGGVRWGRGKSFKLGSDAELGTEQGKAKGNVEKAMASQTAQLPYPAPLPAPTMSPRSQFLLPPTPTPIPSVYTAHPALPPGQSIYDSHPLTPLCACPAYCAA